MKIEVLKNLMQCNEDRAASIRLNLANSGITMFNIISSPGSGKTTLLQKTLAYFQQKTHVAVIEGDVATDKDAQHLNTFGAPIVLVNTEGGCHLDSPIIEKSLDKLPLAELDMIFIENVGNLVCPAEFDLGENAKVAVLRVMTNPQSIQCFLEMQPLYCSIK